MQGVNPCRVSPKTGGGGLMPYPIFYSDKYKSIEGQFDPDTDISISNGLLEFEWDDGRYYG